jgi:hypothetical protein
MTLPHEAYHHWLDGGYRGVAAMAIGRSEKTVEAHCVRSKELDGNGLPSPAQRVIETTLALKEQGHPDPLFMLRYLARECGCILLPVAACGDATALDDVAKLTREFGEVLAATSQGLADNILTPEDSQRIVEQLEDLIGAALRMLRAHHQIVVEGEEARERNRRGPYRPLPRFFELRRVVVGGVA